jgi:hypothetical protein
MLEMLVQAQVEFPHPVKLVIHKIPTNLILWLLAELSLWQVLADPTAEQYIVEFISALLQIII